LVTKAEKKKRLSAGGGVTEVLRGKMAGTTSRKKQIPNEGKGGRDERILCGQSSQQQTKNVQRNIPTRSERVGEGIFFCLRPKGKRNFRLANSGRIEEEYQASPQKQKKKKRKKNPTAPPKKKKKKKKKRRPKKTTTQKKKPQQKKKKKKKNTQKKKKKKKTPPKKKKKKGVSRWILGRHIAPTPAKGKRGEEASPRCP